MRLSEAEIKGKSINPQRPASKRCWLRLVVCPGKPLMVSW